MYECPECGGLHTEAVDECRYCETTTLGTTATDAETAEVEQRTGQSGASTEIEGNPSPNVSMTGELPDNVESHTTTGYKKDDTPGPSAYERVRTTLHLWRVRVAATARTVARATGIAVVIFAAADFFSFVLIPLFGVYGSVLQAVPQLPLNPIADVFLMAVGASLTWFI